MTSETIWNLIGWARGWLRPLSERHYHADKHKYSSIWFPVSFYPPRAKILPQDIVFQEWAFIWSTRFAPQTQPSQCRPDQPRRQTSLRHSQSNKDIKLAEQKMSMTKIPVSYLRRSWSLEPAKSGWRGPWLSRFLVEVSGNTAASLEHRERREVTTDKQPAHTWRRIKLFPKSRFMKWMELLFL